VSCLIEINEEKKIYETPYKIKVNKNECNQYKPIGTNWYIDENLDYYRISPIENYNAQTLFLDILKNNNSILEHCCFHKDFFEVKNLKIVNIGNIKLKNEFRNQKITKKLFNNQKKLYFKKGFNFIILSALFEASFIWYKIGFNFINLEDKQYIEKLFREFLVLQKDKLNLKIKDIIKIKLENSKIDYFVGFREFLETIPNKRYIPMFQKIKD